MSNEATSQKNWFARHKVLTGVLGFFLFIVLVGAMPASQKTTNVSLDDFSLDSLDTAPEVNPVIRGELNEPIDLGTHTLTVLNFREATTISSKYGQPKIAKKGAKFVIFEVEVTAQTNTEFTFFPDKSLDLFDSENRYFKQYDDTIGSIDNYITVRTLSPGIVETGVIVYEIPEADMSYALFATNEQTQDRYMVYFNTQVNN